MITCLFLFHALPRLQSVICAARKPGRDPILCATVVNADTGEIQSVTTQTDDEGFCVTTAWGKDAGRRVWRRVTAAALPEQARRRRPSRGFRKAKGGDERSRGLLQASVAVRQALRHAGVRAAVEAIRVQREPFEGKGARVEALAEGTRFDKHRHWHVEVAFREPVSGPLAIGDGRFLGLGVMAPIIM